MNETWAEVNARRRRIEAEQRARDRARLAREAEVARKDAEERAALPVTDPVHITLRDVLHPELSIPGRGRVSQEEYRRWYQGAIEAPFEEPQIDEDEEALRAWRAE